MYYYRVAIGILYVPCIIRFVSQPSFTQFGLQIPHITPSFVIIQPWVNQRLFHWVPFSTLDLKKVEKYQYFAKKNFVKDSFHLDHCIYLQEICNQVNSLSTDFLPWVWWVHECSILNLFINVFIFIEWKSTR